MMKILVAYDGSASSDKALDEAIVLADKFKGTITLLHVAWEMSDDETHYMLRPAIERLKKAGVKHKEKIERSQYPPRRIIRTAMDEACDLIVIGSRGLGGGKAWVLGSVSSRVIEEANCPVLVVK
jgi:nucleotide-binding universal stress UspA family protein